MPIDNEYGNVDWNKTDSGLPDDFVATISRSSEFKYDPAYNNGETLFFEVILEPDADSGIEASSLYPLRVTVGNGWETDDGESVYRVDGKAKNFNNNSYIGLWIDAMVGELEVDMGQLIKEKDNTPNYADFWRGLTFRWERKEFTYNIQGQEQKSNRMIPSEFVSAGNKPTVKGAVKKAAVKKATVKKASDVTLDDLADILTAHISDGELDADAYTAAALEAFPDAKALIDDIDAVIAVWEAR